MNKPIISRGSIVTVAIVSALLAACAAAPVKPDGADSLRTRLTRLQSDSELASRAPLAIKEADVAVSAAEKPQADKVLGAHLVFMADRSIEVAQALAESRLAVDQRKTIEEQREAMRLAARTQEADSANRRAAAAQSDADNQKREAGVQKDAANAARSQADAARSQADTATEAAALAQRNSAEMQMQIDALHAQATDRGLVLTLGDVLFRTGGSSLNAGGTAQLAKLAVFLNKYPDRTVLIEGHTDSVGSIDSNQALSQRRADAVKAYLVEQSIAGTRLTASGKGAGSPIGDNSSATGRQQNRRVEVIIANNMVSAR
jgi:outer membrane protein OmpA-like peptidoglycan-associated protein